MSLICGSCVERGKACLDTGAPVGVVIGRVLERMNRKRRSTVAGHAGGLARSSEDVLVMGAERRGWVILWIAGRSTRRLWEESDERTAVAIKETV